MMNGAIRAREVRLIGAEGEQLGVTPTSEALMQAENLNMDLVLISNQEPPVAKIMDYTKFMFEQKKKQKEAKFILSNDHLVLSIFFASLYRYTLKITYNRTEITIKNNSK
mgnify:CR=1 FL=1